MDLNHLVGSDLNVSNTGDLALVSGDDETQQRILRRLITNVDDYIFHTDYGAGLGAMVGDPGEADAIRGIILGQLALEDAVAKSPVPTVTVTPLASGVFCSIAYYDAAQQKPYTLSFSVNN